MKKSDNTWLWIAGAIVLVLAVKMHPATTGMASATPNLANSTSPIETAPSGGGGGSSHTVTRVNLSEQFLPYISSYNPQSSCSMAGGLWQDAADNVGCYSTLLPIDSIIECNSTEVINALGACTDVGAATLCDRHNIACYYTE